MTEDADVTRIDRRSARTALTTRFALLGDTTLTFREMHQEHRNDDMWVDGYAVEVRHT